MEKSASLFSNVSKIQYQLHNNVTSTDPGYEPNHIFVVFSSGTWLDFFSTAGSLNLKESPSFRNGNRYWSYEVSGYLPDASKDKDEELELIDSAYLILKLTFPDGRERIIGNKDIGVKFQAPYTSEKSGTGFNFSFNCVMNRRAAWLQPPV